MENFKTNPPEHTLRAWASRHLARAYLALQNEPLKLVVPRRRFDLTTPYVDWKHSQNFGEVA